MRLYSKLLVMTLTGSVFLGNFACEQKKAEPGKPAVDASGCPHEIKKEMCPFCTPSLIESDGFCGEHGVAEALCYQCRPYLKAAFRAKGDWCTKHSAPDSQCVACHPELSKKARPGSGHGTTSGRARLGDSCIVRDFKC
jgi:hypothetical protein